MTTDEEVLEMARDRLETCIPGGANEFDTVFGVAHGVVFGCTDGWLWCADHGSGMIGERTDLPNAGNQIIGRKAAGCLSISPTKVYELPLYVFGRMGA